jgi:hypothetical protein
VLHDQGFAAAVEAGQNLLAALLF